MLDFECLSIMRNGPQPLASEAPHIGQQYQRPVDREVDPEIRETDETLSQQRLCHLEISAREGRLGAVVQAPREADSVAHLATDLKALFIEKISNLDFVPDQMRVAKTTKTPRLANSITRTSIERDCFVEQR
jgi:hypothetical protein